MSKIVAVMCGHGTSSDGSWDCGCSYTTGGKTYTEAALMLPITKAAVKYLRAQKGITVISDADSNNNKNMLADVSWANRVGADVYVSIHCDYYKAASGVYPLYVSTSGKKLATALNTQVKKVLGMKSRGVGKRTDLYELNGTDGVACILETGAIKADLSVLKNKSDAYGKAIAKGICNYLGITYKDTSTTTTTKKTTSTTTTKSSRMTKTNLKSLQAWLEVDQCGYISRQDSSCKEYIDGLLDVINSWTATGNSKTVLKLQKILGVTADGLIGPKTVKAFQKYLNSKNSAGLTVDGYWGDNTTKAVIKFLETNPAHPTIPTTKKTTTVTTTKTTSTNRVNFINALKEYGAIIEKTFTYSRNKASKSWSAAKSTKRTNCATYVGFCLQKIGILKSGKYVYYQGSGKSGLKGNGKSALLKSSKVTVTYPNKVWNACNLVPGDICMFSSGTHTMVYGGKNKSGKPLWYTAGGSDIRAKNVTLVRKTVYEKRKVSCKIHIK